MRGAHYGTLLLTMALVACDETTDPTAGAVFRIQACTTESFHVRITDADVVRQAEDLIGELQQQIVAGDLARGSGGFNHPWSWHLEPASVTFADAAVELCDGCPEMIEDDLDYWVETVGRFCPWSTRVVERVD